MTERTCLRQVAYSLAAIGAIACAGDARSENAEELEDAASRIQYAYYTSDARALEAVATLVEGFEVDSGLEALRAYHLAYAQWRLAQLLTVRSQSGSRSTIVRAMEACAKHSQEAVIADARFADAYAIQAACPASARIASLTLGGKGNSDRTSCRARALDAAASLAPDNPRVRLIAALCAGETEDPEKLRQLVAAFDAAPPRTSRTPDWGHAESLALLGRSYLTRGEPVAARDALERALVIAPDYRTAQEWLQAAASRPL